MPMFQCAGCERLKMLAVHGHGRGTCLCTCLVYAACIVAFVACENADKFSVMYLILLKSPMHGHGRGTRLGTCLV